MGPSFSDGPREAISLYQRHTALFMGPYILECFVLVTQQRIFFLLDVKGEGFVSIENEKLSYYLFLVMKNTSLKSRYLQFSRNNM